MKWSYLCWGVPDGDILEYMAVSSQKLVCPGTHLPPLLVHAPHHPVSLQGFAAWEEVRGHVLQSRGRNSRRNIFSVVALIWSPQVSDEVPGYHQRCPVGALSDGREGAFGGNRVVEGHAITKNESVLSHQRYLETQNSRPVLLDCLYLEMGGFPVEDRHPPLVSTQRIICEDTVDCQCAPVNPIGDLVLLE